MPVQSAVEAGPGDAGSLVPLLKVIGVSDPGWPTRMCSECWRRSKRLRLTTTDFQRLDQLVLGYYLYVPSLRLPHLCEWCAFSQCLY